MITEYEILTQVKFRNRFFSNNKLECFTIQPDLNTEHFFLRSGIVFKVFNDGIMLFFNSFAYHESISRNAILDGSVLRFKIILNDHYFFNYTDGELDDFSTSLYYFNNAAKVENGFSNQNLQLDEFVSIKDGVDINDFDQQFFKKPFGVIDIQLHKDLQNEYFLSFKEKESHWRYIIVSDYLINTTQLAILGDDVEFEGPEKIFLPNGKEVLSFVSVTPINHREKPKKYYKLVDYYEKGSSTFKIMINMLPIPDINTISSSVKVTNDSKQFSEIFIY